MDAVATRFKVRKLAEALPRSVAEVREREEGARVGE
jgi:hypothetical protein